MAISDEELLAGRKKAYGGPDRDLYLDVGFYLLRYSHVEHAITHVLALSTRSNDLEAFDILCRGMDARVKIDRLRKSAERHGGIGPNLRQRLALFEKEFIPMRNKIVHSTVAINEDDGPRRYYISGIANMPWEELNMGPPRTRLKPHVVSSLWLYGAGVWLSYLAKDFMQVMLCARARTTLEIASPQSHLRSESSQQTARKAGRAKPDKPPRKGRGK